MVEERQLDKAPRQGKAHAPPVNAAEFEAAPEFEQFRAVMRCLLAVPKSELDELVIEAKAMSPRIDNPTSAGRKPKARA